jgi:putative transposase
MTCRAATRRASSPVTAAPRVAEAPRAVSRVSRRIQSSGPASVPEPSLLREAFLWSERRKAGRTALVSLHGNTYQVDAWLAGRTVELLFDPFDLDRLEVRLAGKPAGTAVPFAVSRHRHPKTRTPDGGQRTEPAPTGIDYLSIVGDGHDAALREQVSYLSLISPRQEKEQGEGEGRD